MLKDEDAISVVVSVVLLLGLLVAVLGIVHVSYVPEWRRSAETAHMDDVFEDLADLKSGIDLVAAVSPDTVCTVSQPVRLGGGAIPVISPRNLVVHFERTHSFQTSMWHPLITPQPIPSLILARSSLRSITSMRWIGYIPMRTGH